jgi:CHAD domain-containing protein
MTLNRLQNYYWSLDSEFHVLLAELLEKQTEKGLHALRVNVKKHLAFFNLMPFLDKNFPVKNARKPFRACMKQTGRLRDIEVELGILTVQENTNKPVATFTNHLQEEHLYYQALLKQFGEEFSILRVREISETVKGRLTRLEGRIDLWVNLNSYFLYQLDLVRQSVLEVISLKKSKPMHQLRTHVKEMMLNLKLLQELVSHRVVRLEKIYRQLDSLQDLLGTWHDRANLHARIKGQKKLVSKKMKLAVKREKKACRERILFYLKSFPLLHLLALDVFHDLFSHPPVEIPGAKNPGYQPKPEPVQEASFHQLNLSEGRK